MLNTTKLSFCAHSSGKDDIIGWILKVRKRCLHVGEEVGGVQSLCEPCSRWTWWHIGFWRHVIRCDCQHYASERVPAQGIYRHTDDAQNTKLYSQEEVVTFLIRQYLTVLHSRFVLLFVYISIVGRCHSGFGFPGLRHPRVIIYPRGFGIPVPNTLSGFGIPRGIPRGIWHPDIFNSRNEQAQIWVDLICVLSFYT